MSHKYLLGERAVIHKRKMIVLIVIMDSHDVDGRARVTEEVALHACAPRAAARED